MTRRPRQHAQYERYRNYAKPYHERFGEMPLDFDEVAAACGEAIDWPEIALRFVLGLPNVHTAIVGTTRTANIEPSVAAARKGPLPAAAVELIRAAFAAAEPESAWPGLT